MKQSRRRGVASADFVLPGLALPSGIRVEDLTSDPQKQAERAADSACFATATARWFAETRRAQRLVAAQVERIRVPTLWLLGSEDRLADPECSRRLAGSIAGAEVAVFPGMRHEVWNEVGRAAVFDRMGAFLADVRT